MPKEPFMLVSLKEDKARKLSQVLSNPTATTILNYLTGKDATETEISEKLGIPLSTVHYNLKQLKEARLVVVDEFHYSEKGKEVNHYKLANKYIIIAPEEDDSFLQHLKKYLPAAVIVGGLAIVLKTMQFLTPLGQQEMGADAFAMQAPGAARMAMDSQAAGLALEAEMVADAGTMAAKTFVEPNLPWWQSSMVDWFLIGAAFVLVVMIIGELIFHWRRKK